MNLIDSSCWLEYFSGSKISDHVADAIENLENLIVPSITIFEVFKKLLIETDEDKAIFAIAHMKQGKVIDLDSDIAVSAAKIGLEKNLPMADSIILATARKYNCLLWTLDKHFKGLDKVKYFEKR